MKIIILTPNYPRKNAPMNGIFIHQQIKALQELGCECHILLDHNWFPPAGLHSFHSYWRSGFDTFHNQFDEYEGITIHKVSTFIKMPNRYFPDNYYERLAKAFADYIKNTSVLKDADWLYTHFFTDFGFIGTKVKRLTEMKLAAIARGDDIHAWPLLNPELLQNIREVFLHADLLLANSNQLGKDANYLLFQKERKPVKVVYNGVDFNKFRPAVEGEKSVLKDKFHLDKKKNHIICVATPVALKGWLLLFDAIAALKEELRGWQLICVAVNRSSNDALNLKNESKNRGIENYVTVLGQVPHNSLAELYRAMDAFVLPSDNEGMANALLEAAASNLQLIATKVGGHPEIFDESPDCSLIEPGDLEGLIAAMRKLIDRDQSLPVNTMEMVLKVGSYKKNAIKLLEYFNE